MQLTGGQFTSETAILGNDLSTFPDFPAEIRAPAGSLPGVSGFQLHFADHDILTPGDAPDVLVAMNLAALKVNLGDLPRGATLIVNTDAFTSRNLEKAGYAADPLGDGSLTDYQVHAIPLTSLTLEALKDVEISKKEAERAKNMFALGLMSWLYSRPIDGTVGFLERKFGARTFQAEDEIAAVGASLGAAFGGSLAVCTSSGPGIALKAETMGLAVALELPLLVIDIQRGGPSTGLPTKTEQSDLLQVMFGRNGEAPIPVMAATTPAD